MAKVIFKNVGQGDSIIIEWEDDGKTKIGIIDCHIYENKNPIIDYLSSKSIVEIEFVILSHFHYDHFSGMPDLFNFCLVNNIKINWFFHTIEGHILKIYDKIFTSKRLEKAVSDFFDSLEKAENIINDLSVNFHSAPLKLSSDYTLFFLSPSIKTGRNFAKQINRRVNVKKFTYDDINKFSTIVLIKGNNRGILITSDAVKGSFKNLENYIDNEMHIVQSPHHGSLNNIYPHFWNSLRKTHLCPAVFSVGYEPKDKLPDKETVAFFDNLGYKVYSTNPTYGISEFFNVNFTYSNTSKYKTNLLNQFSKKTNTIHRIPVSNSQFEGEQSFQF